jgi:ribosome maturation factor RimP
MNLIAIKAGILPIVQELGYDLYDLKYLKVRQDGILQVTIDKPEGDIDIEDCVKVSEAVSLYLDDTDPIAEDYQLEVTSPGAERELRNPTEVERFKGHYVFVKTHETEHFGILGGLQNNIITLTIKNKPIGINYIDVVLIRLAIKF